MPELDDLHRQLAKLRREAVALLREGCTPTQLLKLQRDVVHLWGAVEQHKRVSGPGRGSLH